jgi:hypothetical protein
MRRFLALVLVAAAGAVPTAFAADHGHTPTAHAAAVCADYPNQAAAQAAGDTVDADHDGIYCESLPCPCSTAPPNPPAPTPTKPPTPTQPAPLPSPTPTVPAPSPPVTDPPPATAPTSTIDTSADSASCTTPTGVQNVTFSKTKYPNIRKHFLAALRKGWPRTLVVNRVGASKRRARLLEGVKTKAGYARDEYPPAAGRGFGNGLTKGSDPTGWRADLTLVPSHESQSHVSSMASKLRRFCSGTKFRYVFD